MKNGFLYLTLLHFFKQLFLSFAEVCGQLHVVCDDEVTHSAVASKKRFRFTGTGKIKRHHAYHSHILTKKTKKQKRNLVHQTIVDNSNLKQVRDLLCLR